MWTIEKKEASMRKFLSTISQFIFLIFFCSTLSGCTLIFQKGRREDAQKINALQQDYSRLQNELSELERAKAELEDRLRGEIGDKQVSVEMNDRGLVITFVAEVLFDSGKADLRPSALEKLEKVANVLNTTVQDLNIGIEGHTDNQPIKYSGWKSNWELSTARALSVLHYMISEHETVPDRLSATGYGEYHPIDTNDTKEGRQRNRRVEIVILPKTSKEQAVFQEQSQTQSQNLK
jgi:chemotaxis protein MotB